jgi:hypothetical protein
MLHQLREMGLTVVALEAGAGVGGAWYWNRYPGARCDIESLVYCYSFSPIIDDEWSWTERYATQPEIVRYINFVCDRLDLRKDICFNSRLVKATFDEEAGFWTFYTENGDVYRARHFVSRRAPSRSLSGLTFLVARSSREKSTIQRSGLSKSRISEARGWELSARDRPELNSFLLSQSRPNT